ncbi:MAG: efflux RND transporter permease subunit [Desulfobacterales bacterium]|nr:efflux RND transporter permease subunit [Desulfobacterales bacterium]
MIFKFDPSMIPIMGLMVSGNRSPEELREVAERTIQPRIEQVQGVALAGVSGGRQRVVRVEVPLERLEAYGLTVNQIVNMLRGQNVQVAAGSIVDGEPGLPPDRSRGIQDHRGDRRGGDRLQGRRLQSRHRSRAGAQGPAPGHRQRLRRLPGRGQPCVRERHPRRADHDPEAERQELRSDRQRGAGPAAAASAGELPQGVLDDRAVQHDRHHRELHRQRRHLGAVDGALLAVIILFIFLRSCKPTLVIGITIPISLLFTLMLMYFAGLTLNIMTLAGLALGVGMLVDNSIVILENIYRYREKGDQAEDLRDPRAPRR